MPKRTLLEIVQKILVAIDGEEVNTLGDTTEATQIANIVEDTYYNLITNREVPEHESFIKLTAASDINFPTHFTYPTDVHRIDCVWYDTSNDGSFEYTEIKFLEPLAFIKRIDSVQSNFEMVLDKSAGTSLRIVNDTQPEFYTSFDDTNIVFNSYNSEIDDTLRESKVRAHGVTHPSFIIADNFVPDIDENYFPLLLAESTSTAQSLFAGGSDPKTEQAARRNRMYIQNDKYKTQRKSGLSNYGR